MTDRPQPHPRPEPVERGPEPHAPSGKLPYDPPLLVAYGSVAKLTQGTLTWGWDGPMGGKRRMACL
jgi:hypothetical protein